MSNCGAIQCLDSTNYSDELSLVPTIHICGKKFLLRNDLCFLQNWNFSFYKTLKPAVEEEGESYDQEQH